MSDFAHVAKAILMGFATLYICSILITILFIVVVEFNSWRRKHLSIRDTAERISDNDILSSQVSKKLNDLKP